MSEFTPELRKKLEELAEANEESIQDVMLLFQALRLKVAEVFPHISDMKLDQRTYNGLQDYYNNKKFNKGQEMIFIPFGISSESTDTNKELRDEIVKDFANPNNRMEMITSGKVMVMKVSDKPIDNQTVFYPDVYKPVKLVRKMTKLDSGEYVVVDADLWEPGDTPIPRDFRRTIQYQEDGEAYDNYQYSQPLLPKYKLSIIGLGFFTGNKTIKTPEGPIKKQKNPIEDGLVTKITFTGKTEDLANPESPKYIIKRPIWFKACKLKATDTKYSNALYLNVNAKTEFEISDTKIHFVDYKEDGVPKKGLLTLVNERVLEQAQKVKDLIARTDFNEMPKDKAKKLHELEALYKKFMNPDVPYIPVIDLAGINQYHLTHRALHNDDGTVKKDEKGVWDDIDFNSFAICECSLTGIYEKDGQPPKMILSDYSLAQDESVFTKFSNGISKELPSSSVYICLTTSRGNQAYDTDTKKFVFNPEEAVAIPKVKGISIILDFTKLDIKKLVGDM